jgi:hypothetical protein
VVTDAGMVTDAKHEGHRGPPGSFILGMKVADVPYVMGGWRREHPGEEIPDRHDFTQS